MLIEGLNGCGKTSFLEAFHYLCYLRSFRTHTPRDLVQFGHEGFFIKALFTYKDDATAQELQVGFSDKRRWLKLIKSQLNLIKSSWIFIGL